MLTPIPRDSLSLKQGAFAELYMSQLGNATEAGFGGTGSLASARARVVKCP